MSIKNKKYFIIDFDSTFIKSEGLDELAALVLKDSPKYEQVLKKIRGITSKGMQGEIPFGESLRGRLSLIRPNKRHVEELSKYLKTNISSSISRNKKFFEDYKDSIFIISGGFKDYIIPIVDSFGISSSHVFANTFIFDKSGNYKGFDTANPLAQDDGKVKLVKSLKLKGDVYVLGDGYTDYKLRELGLARKFIAFTENISRDIVSAKADQIASSFDDFLYDNKLPMSTSYPKSRINAILIENIDNSAVVKFEKEGYSVEYYNKSLPEDEIREKIENKHIIGIRSRTKITREILGAGRKLLTIGAFCIGVNQIDLKTAGAQGSAVFNAPYSSTRSVVELIIGYIFAINRDIVQKNNDMHNGIWSKTAKEMHEIRGRTLGIVGYGNIGTQLSVLAEALGMNVVYYDVFDKLALGNAKSCKSLTELFNKSDIISIHVDGNERNKNLIGEKEFASMRDRVIFINASRGLIVDTKAFINNIKNGKIRGAALDVFTAEPKSKDEEFVSEMRKFPNVILTPHVGGSTEESQRNIADFVSGKIIDFINTGSTISSVNLPNIQAQKQSNSHRLLHLHKNVPGILAKINAILAENDMNIIAQYLKTKEDIGYLITDVDKKYNDTVLGELKKLPNTIRFRVLY